MSKYDSVSGLGFRQDVSRNWQSENRYPEVIFRATIQVCRIGGRRRKSQSAPASRSALDEKRRHPCRRSYEDYYLRSYRSIFERYLSGFGDILQLGASCHQANSYIDRNKGDIRCPYCYSVERHGLPDRKIAETSGLSGMSRNDTTHWLLWAQEIQALAQTGETYAENNFQSERYHRLIEIAAQMISEYSNLDQDSLVVEFSSQKGYATPKIDVRGVVFKDGKLLFVRERIDGGWTLPGGWVDVGDKPSEAVEREILEESGLRVKAKKVIGIYDANRIPPMDLFHAYKILFLCEFIDGSPKSSSETSEVEFFSRDEVPKKLSEERTRRRHIVDAFAEYDIPGRETVFD